jgi:GH15 family glucan-1,4-alpha-glucosidase
VPKELLDGIETELSGGVELSSVRNSVDSILRLQSENGAFIASPDFAEYHYSWLRDGSFCAYALDRAGEHDASRRFHSWVNGAVDGIKDIIDDVVGRHERGEKLDPSHMPPARFALDGSTVTDDWPNFQIDGYGTWLWSLGQHLLITGQHEVPAEFVDSVRRVGHYLASFALSPCYDVWEESGSALHTSTLACVYGGLTTAARLLNDVDLLERSFAVQERVKLSATQLGMYAKSNENADVDASALWLSTPFRVVEPTDPSFVRTVSAIASQLTLFGGIRRYPTDVFFGSGAWPVLTASLGWHYLTVGDLDGARRCHEWISARFDDEGRLGEQFDGELRDAPHYHEWVERWGPPARDLTWSHAMYVVLSLALETFDGSDKGGVIFPLIGESDTDTRGSGA